MEDLPDLWRTAVLHPLSVHFPVALLLFGTGCRVVGAFADRARHWGFLVPAARLALVLGTAGAWVAVVTGENADGVVGRTLCDPTVAKTHQQLAWAVAITFSCAVPIDLTLDNLPARGRRLLTVPVIVAMLVGGGLLAYTGHLGATLVYQQGAAVHHPSESCAEFE